MEFRILGPLEVLSDDEPVALGRGKERALLALLLLNRNETVSRDRLVDELWGETAPETAAKSIQTYVSRLRKALPNDSIRTRQPGYLIDVAEGELDLDRFEALLAAGREALADSDPHVASTKLTEALAFWRGPALVEFESEPFAATEAARLDELRLSCVEERIEADLALGRHAELVGELEALIARHPLRERFRGQLMLALYRSGRQAESLAAYQEARRELVEELGIEPGTALQELEKRILQQDEQLDLPRSVESDKVPSPPVSEDATIVETDADQGARSRETRKLVTLLFLQFDVSPLEGRLDPERLRGVMTRLSERATEELHRHGGMVELAPGGDLIVAFGVPTVHEDDALRAARAAFELRNAIRREDSELARGWAVRASVRIGIATGRVLVGARPDGTPLVEGEAVREAERLGRGISAGSILVSPDTEELVRGAAKLEQTEIAVAPDQRSVAWELVAIDDEADALERRLDAPLVGREPELRLLREAYERTCTEGTSHLFTILGAPGIGKTRLVTEFSRSVGRSAQVLVGRCRSYGEGITYWPVAEMVKSAAGDRPIRELLANTERPELVAERINEAIGLAGGTNGTSQETIWAFRKFFEELADTRPLVLVFEDVHWAKPLLLDLVEHLVDWARTSPILIVCLGRQELLVARADWGGGKLNASSVLLETLSDQEAASLIANIGSAELPGEIQERVTSAAGGNPLFLEQLVAMLAGNGRAGSQDDLPPAIQALLAARLDQLPDNERETIELASIEGEIFHRGGLGYLVGDGSIDAEIEQHLDSLIRKDFVRPHRGEGGNPDAFRFAHVLIREAAYDSMAKERRARLHERFACWLEAESQEPHEGVELAGYHFAEAHRYWSELGPLNEHALALGRQAATRLASAGERALARGDTGAGVNLLRQATNLLPEQEASRLELLPDLAGALKEAGHLSEAETVATQAVQLSRATGRQDLEWRARAELQLILSCSTTAAPPIDELRENARKAVEVFERIGDERGLARAWRMVAETHNLSCQYAALGEAMERSVEHARRAEDGRAERVGRYWILSALHFGPAHADFAKGICDEVLASDEHLGVRASASRTRGFISAMEGRFDEARDLIAEAKEIFEDLGSRTVAASTSGFFGAEAELLAGDLARAEAQARDSYDSFKKMDDIGLVSTIGPLLAHILYQRGCYDELETLAEESRRISADGDQISQILWRGASALCRARSGEFETAEELCRDSVLLAEQTDSLNTHALVLMDLAEVLDISDKPADAADAIDLAIGLYERKGNVVAARKAQAVRDRLGAFA